jgi:hypothetical protein
MNKIFFGLLLLSIVFACKPKSQYEQTVKRELSSGIKNDTLFHGFHFGMESKAFYDKCWELNKKGLAREGAQNATVYQKITDLKYEAGFEFYPRFKNDKVQSMVGYVQYIGWAPWNKDLQSDVLIEDVKEMFERWYGPGFIPIKSPGIGNAYVRIDGNRRLVLYYNKEQRVEFLYSDLTNPDNLLKLANQQ